MKRITVALLLTVLLLCMSIPVLASSFGVSPSSAEFEVPKDGSTTQDFTFTGYTGTVTIGLENIPLSVDPIGSITVTDGQTVPITFYGDGTNNTYEGKITFLASTGEQALTGIKVRLTIHVNVTTEVVTPTPPPQPPTAPTNLEATDSVYTDTVVVTWTKSTGATGYKVYEGSNLLDTLGDVATYDDATAPAGIITSGIASASDSTVIAHVVLSLTGESTTVGASRTYKVVAFNDVGDSVDSNTDTGYRGVGALTYQWQRSDGKTDSDFSPIDGATSTPYNDTGAPVNGDSRWYYCEVSATGATTQDSAHDSGYRDVEVTPPPRPSGGNGGTPWYPIKTDLFGAETTFYTEHDGYVTKTVKATSEDGNLTVTIPKGTIALEKDGKRLKTLEVAVNETPPEPPKDASIIGIPYDFGPSGATFDPPITFTWSYDPDTLPKDVAEENLVLAYYIDGQWVELECVVDTETNTITALVSHFTTFAIIGPVTPVPPVVVEPEPVEVPPPPVVTVPPVLEPVAPVVPPTPEVVTPTPEPVAPEPVVLPVPEEPEAFPLWAIILIGLGVPAIAGLVYWLVRRRKAA